MYWPLDSGGSADEVQAQMAPIVMDARSLQYIDGRCLHATKAFVGERYSLVFFKVRGADKISGELQRQLVRMGASCADWRVQGV